MLFMHLVIMLCKAYFGDMRLDPSGVIKVIALWICVAAYSPLIYAIYDATLWFNALVADTNVNILESLDKLADNSYLKQHTTTANFGFTDVKLPFDDATSFFTWIVLMVENGLAMIVRIFIERIRAMLLAFTLACGPVAFTIATIPGFGGTAGHWLRIFISTSLWGLTLSILDGLMASFIQNFNMPTGDSMTEAAVSLDILVVNGAVILMYLSVPLLTSFYIGSAASASFLRAAQGAAGMASMYAGGAATKAVKDWYNKNGESQEKTMQQVNQHKQLEQSSETVK